MTRYRSAVQRFTAYVAGRLARAVAAEARAGKPHPRTQQWAAVLEKIMAGDLSIGSRTPLADTPAWATPEVMHGGFATGAMHAAGALLPHERALLDTLQATGDTPPRRVLNEYFLTEAGFARLAQWLADGCYRIDVPEEGVLLTVAWLATHGRDEEARRLLATVQPYFERFRFYPVPAAHPAPAGPLVHVRTADEARRSLEAMRPNPRIVAQRITTGVWTALHDRTVALFLETMQGDRPCRRWPAGWHDRADALLDEFHRQSALHPCTGKAARWHGHQAMLRALLAKCATSPDAMTEVDVCRIRHILECYVAKRGKPGSRECEAARERARADVRAPLYSELAEVVARRLSRYPADAGVADVAPLREPVGAAEATDAIAANTPIPRAVAIKAGRCLSGTPADLIGANLIKSADMLAAVLPQATARAHAQRFRDPALGSLYAQLYRAFRRRRSLLLLDLQKQVQFEELPWAAALDGLRDRDEPQAPSSRRLYIDIAALTLRSFPEAPVPNKLLQEFRALAAASAAETPLTEELAADIFMGAFTDKFVLAAQRAAALLEGSLYARYYDIDYAEIAGLRVKPARSGVSDAAHAFAQLCRRRAGVSPGWGRVARNGMVIEQQQILTTQNLAALWSDLPLREALGADLPRMCHRVFRRISGALASQPADRHAQLIQLKNAAYAWRQLLFFLSMLDPGQQREFLDWARRHLDGPAHRVLRPLAAVLAGLEEVLAGAAPASPGRHVVRPFLGWVDGAHPLAL